MHVSITVGIEIDDREDVIEAMKAEMQNLPVMFGKLPANATNEQIIRTYYAAELPTYAYSIQRDHVKNGDVDGDYIQGVTINDL